MRNVLYLVIISQFFLACSSIQTEISRSISSNPEVDENCYALLHQIVHGGFPDGQVSIASLNKIPDNFMDRHLEIVKRFKKDTSLKCQDQGAKGTCWLNSTLNFFENFSKEQFGKQVPLSDAYLLRGRIMKMVRASIDSPDRTVQHSKYFGGGTHAEALELAAEFGLVPQKSYSKRAEEFVRNRNARDRFFTQFRAAFEEVMNLLRVGEIDETEALARAERMISLVLPTARESFQVNGKRYTPSEFYEELYRFQQRREIAANRFSHEEIRDQIITALNTNRPVMISAINIKQYHDLNSGIMSVEPYIGSADRETFMKNILRFTHGDAGNHAMLVVDHAIDDSGNVVFKLADSWGEVGDRGYRYVYWDYFTNFITKATIFE